MFCPVKEITFKDLLKEPNGILTPSTIDNPFVSFPAFTP